MTPDRFERIVAAYGATPARWPADERAAAIAFLQRNPAAADRLQAQAGLDRLLASYTVPAPGAARIGVILRSRSSRPGFGSWWAGLGFAGTALGGALVGALAMVAMMPLLADRQPASWIEEQPITFAPFDMDEEMTR